MDAGYIGLGLMGRAQAERLESAGFRLVVWNRSPGKASGLGARVASDPREVVQSADIVFICLFDSPAVAEVMHAGDGLLAADCSGKVFVDITTNSAAVVPRFRREFAEAGAAYLEAPVLGSVGPASSGALKVLVSGPEPALAKARPLLDRLGRVFYLGEEPGRPTRVKLVNNYVLASFMAAIGEAVALGEAAGIPRDELLDILAEGSAKGVVFDAKRANMLADEFPPSFTVSTILKDLGYVKDLAHESSAYTPLAPAVAALYEEALDGYADADFSAVYRIFRRGAPSGPGTLQPS